MRRPVFLAAALADLAGIREYLIRERGSIAAARRVTDRLRVRCHRIASLPGTLGRERPDLAPGLRSVPESEYIILFRYAGDRLEVVRLLHGSRDIAALMQSQRPDA